MGKTDVWSLAVTIYQLFLGCFPYPGVPGPTRYKKMKHQIIEGIPKPPYRPARGVSLAKSALSLVEVLLVRESSERLSAAQALDHDFVRVADADFNKSLGLSQSSSTVIGTVGTRSSDGSSTSTEAPDAL